MKKPPIPERQNDPNAWANIRMTLDILMGRRGNKIQPITVKKLTSVAAPTKAEYDALASQVVYLQQQFNALVARFDE